MKNQHLMRTILLVALLLVNLPVVAQESHLYRYDNGLTLLVLPQPEAPLVHLETSLSLRGAARNAGLAHMIEHLMFHSAEGSPAGSLADSLLLLTTGHNAYTNSRTIQTDNHCLPGLLPRLLAVEAARFGSLTPDSLALEFERERILGERDWRHETSRTRTALYRLLAMAFGESENGGDPRLGSRADIQGMDLAGVRAFLARWFRPDRMVVSIAGPVDPETVRAEVGATLGALPAATEIQPSDPILPEVEARGAVDVWEDSERDMLAVGFRLPCGTAQQMATLLLTHSIMVAENGHPILDFFEDEALLVIRIWGEWSQYISDEEAAQEASEQFWNEVRKVRYRVKNDWLYDRNKQQHLEDLRDALEDAEGRLKWRAQLLAHDRDLPEPEALVALVDSLQQEEIHTFLTEQFVQEKAFTVFYAGREQDEHSWRRLSRERLELRLNPYLNRNRRPVRPQAFPAELIRPVLSQGGNLNLVQVETRELHNGVPLHRIIVPKAEEMALGAAGRHPDLEDEAPGGRQGRLVFYGWLVNVGYDRKGAAIPPRGERLQWNTHVEVDPGGIAVRAAGPVERARDVAAAMHKRVVVDRINPWGLKWIRENYDEWNEIFADNLWIQARQWRMARLLGQESPQAGYLTIDRTSLMDWSARGMNKMHRKLMEPGCLQVVCAGPESVGGPEGPVARLFANMETDEAEEIPAPEIGEAEVSGWRLDAALPDVALLQFDFPPRPLQGKALENLLLKVMIANRLEMAAAEAALDSVDFQVRVGRLAGGLSGAIEALARPEDAVAVRDLVQNEVGRLQRQPLAAEEEILARLTLMRELVGALQDVEKTRDLYLEWSLLGPIPTNPLAFLAEEPTGEVARRATELFPADHHAWTMIVEPEK